MVSRPVSTVRIISERVDDFARLSQRWDEQAELLLFLRHPGVVGVREYFEGAPFHLADTAAETAGRSLYLVMNWVEGQPLRDWVMKNATTYYPGINLNDDRSGFSFCARTSDRRFAFVAIVDPKVPVALDITIWDPPRR